MDNAGASSPSSSRPPPPASAVYTEQHSQVRVRRATTAFEQLEVRLAEFPYATFTQFRQAAIRQSAGPTPAVAHTCIGVVTRKSDPKQNAGQARASPYAVVTLWSMETISPSPEAEVSLLLCGPAFELLYGRLVRGSVVALSDVAMCARKGHTSGGGGGGAQRTTNTAETDVLLRVSDPMSVRQLGFAADLGTCASVSHKSNERCSVAVNTRLSQHCSYHVGDLRKVARGTATTVTRAGPSPAMKGGALTTHMTLTPAAGVSRRTPPVSAAPHGASVRVTAAQQQQHQQQQLMLRQPSFLAVRGATGLPVEDAAQRRGVLSAGTGVYGGVQSGAPLPLAQQVGLRPSAQYPSAQSLGVSSRGLDVLEAARRQAVELEEGKLLRRSLKPGTGKEVVAAGRLRERDPQGEATRLAGKRRRVDAVPVARASTTPTATATAVAAPASTGADARRVEALRAQFQPLHRGSPAAFTPLAGQSSVHSVIPSAVQKDYRHSIVLHGSTATSSGGQSGQAALLRAAAKAAKDVAAPRPRTDTSERGATSTSAAAAAEDVLPLTLLGAVASRVQSEHDHLRGEADWQRITSFVDKQITKEKALTALEAVTQQEIKAYYCYGCRCWYARPPTTCVEQHHRTELKPALKQYIKCEHCSYKTFIIGGKDARGWKVFPRCPRCHETSYWVRGDAAPQVAGPVEEPHPM